MSWSRRCPRGFLLLFGGAAHAQEIPAQDIGWTWHRPPGLVDCPDSDRVRERVAQRLGSSSPSAASATASHVTVELARAGADHVARVRVQHEAGAPELRELTTEDGCGELEEPLTLTLTLLLSPSSVGWLHAIPESIDPLDPGDATFGGLRFGAALRQDLGRRFGLGVGVSSHLLANTWRFRVRDVEEPVWAQPRAGARAEVLVIYTAD